MIRLGFFGFELIILPNTSAIFCAPILCPFLISCLSQTFCPKGTSIYSVIQIWVPERAPLPSNIVMNWEDLSPPPCNIVMNFDDPPCNVVIIEAYPRKKRAYATFFKIATKCIIVDPH